MLIAYFDESQRSGHYFVAAAVADYEIWEKIDDELDNLRSSVVERFGVPAGVEFHGHPMMGGEDDWVAMRGKHSEIGGIYAQALRIICHEELRVFVQGVDIRRLNARFKYPGHPHAVCMTKILEQVSHYASENEFGEAITVIDETSEETLLCDSFQVSKLLSNTNLNHEDYSMISEPLNFANSYFAQGLQAVDLILYILQRDFHIKKEPHPRAQKLRNKLKAIIEPRIEYRGIWLP